MLRNRTYSKRASVSDGRIQAYGASDGLYLSQDYGVTWSKIYTNRVIQVAFTKNSILIVTDNGVYQSYDNGQNWTQRLTDTGTIISLHVSSNGNNVCAVISSGYYISTDEGETFTFTSINGIFDAFCLNNGSILSVLASLDTFSVRIDGVVKYEGSDYYISQGMCIAVSRDESHIVVCVGDVLISSDGGDTFTKNTTYPETRSGTPSIDIDCKNILISYDFINWFYIYNRIYISNDYGTTWIEKYDANNNIRGYYIDTAMSNDGKYQLAATSLPYLNQSSDYGVTWTAPSTTANVLCVAIK